MSDLFYTVYVHTHCGMAQNREGRLFTKNTGLCNVERLRIGSDACPVHENEQSL